MSDNDIPPVRSLRQRSSKNLPAQSMRRKNIKLEIPEEPSIEDIYRQVDAKMNFKTTPLETIYESPKGKNLSFKDCMGVVKLKRHFRFTPFYNPSKCKIKMRKTKSKKLKRINVNLNNSVSISLEDVEKVLQSISEDENEENHIPSVSENNIEINYKYSVSNTHKENKIHESSSSNIEMNDSVMEEREDKFTSFQSSSESIMHEQKFEELPDFVDSIFSPGKQKSDKLKRDRRRSRRVEPLCLNNSDIDNIGMTEESELRPFAEPDHEIEGFIIQKTVSKAISPEVSEPKRKHTSTKEKTKSKKSRRNSGVNRSIYKTFVDSSFDESDESITESSLNGGNTIIKNMPSPTSLMNRLTIHSPEPTHLIKPVTKKGRRKSARLSMGKNENESSFGTLWIGVQSPKDEPMSVVKEDSTSVKNTMNFIDECIESQPTLIPKIDKQRHDLLDYGSPILSGIFECEARVTKDKTIRRKKGSSLSLDHFMCNF